MFEDADDILRKLAFERGVLTLLKDTPAAGPALEKTIENLDFLIETLALPQAA